MFLLCSCHLPTRTYISPHALPHGDIGFLSGRQPSASSVPGAAVAVFPLFRRCFVAVITAVFVLFSSAKSQSAERFSLESYRR